MSVRFVESYRGVAGVRLYQSVDNPQGPTIAIVGGTHGNEPVGIVTLKRLEDAVKADLKCGRVLAVQANLRAIRRNARFTDDGVDLNRLYDRATLHSLQRMPVESLCYEERRALQLAPLLIECDAILDLHSTSQPSEAFLLFRDDQRHAAMARKLGVQNMVTGMHESAIVGGGLCSNVGLDPGERSRRLGFTFEAGQHQDPGNLERAWQVATRFLFELGVWNTQPERIDVEPKVYEILDRFPQSPAGTKGWSFVDPERSGAHRADARTLVSFEHVYADEPLVRRGNTIVRANSPFTMLMPAPDARPGADLFYYAQRRHGGLLSGEYRTNAEASREANAIERMMDLLADDEMEEGHTWVTFDNRRCLDLCGELIGRTLRLDKNDPDRRITVVGRGDWGTGERERRDGQRYRQAMKQAIKAGVPIERLQVLRGASLGWLDALTAASMRGLLTERQAGPGVRLMLSVRQPHTVSVLVVGDLERALSTGQYRHCRVAIVIEAATVEPNEDTALVRVVRTGIIGVRPELLRAAMKVTSALRREHRHLVQDTTLFHTAGIGSLLGEDGVIESSSDVDALAALRIEIVRTQLRGWYSALRVDLCTPLHLPNSRALGRWLASIMTRSGILDVESLRKLLIRPSGNGWVADISYLKRLSTHGTEDDINRLLETVPGPASPQQPIVAADVDGDNLERWIGWKRYLRGVDIVPGDRGKDLDLAFSEANIRGRITRWLTAAVREARERPGEVLVVMAGDGLDPHAKDLSGAQGLLDAHRALLLSPQVRYLRIQHTQGTHLSWMKNLVQTVEDRPEGEPVGLLFEAEHGASVNVVMVCSKAGEVEGWSLDGWSIDRCAVVVSDHEMTIDRDYKLALFTERVGEHNVINQELLHFGRAHCSGLLKQSGGAAVEKGSIRAEYCRHVERWLEHMRAIEIDGGVPIPTNGSRAGWVKRELGIADRDLAAAIADQISLPLDAEDAVAEMWQVAESWPPTESW